jgi:hypothetical protein
VPSTVSWADVDVDVFASLDESSLPQPDAMKAKANNATKTRTLKPWNMAAQYRTSAILGYLLPVSGHG